jgi:hypothetical protein
MIEAEGMEDSGGVEVTQKDSGDFEVTGQNEGERTSGGVVKLFSGALVEAKIIFGIIKT